MGRLAITVDHDFETGIAVVAASGELSFAAAVQLRDTALRSLVEHPLAVVVDLDSAVPPAHDAVAELAVLGTRKEIFICGDRSLYPSMLVYPDRREAIAAALSSRRNAKRVHAHLPPSPEAPRAARELVAGACARWRVQRLCHDAQLIVSELVTNGVMHARSDLEVTVAVSRTHLHLYVRDRHRGLPQLAARAPGRSIRRIGGLGLMLVDGLATAWGTTAGVYGKTVWATLAL